MNREARHTCRAALVLAVIFCGCSVNRTHLRTVPAGTRLTVFIVDSPGADGISTREAFETRTVDAVTVGGETLIPAGTIVRCRLTNAATGEVLVLDKFQNARGEWQDLPVNSIPLGAEGAPIRIAAGQRLDVRTEAPMNVLLIGSRKTDLASSS